MNAVESLNEEGKSFLKEILKATDRMEGLIDGLLALSRASRAEMACENLDLTTLVELVYLRIAPRRNRSAKSTARWRPPSLPGATCDS